MLSYIIQGIYRAGQKRFAKWLFYGLLLVTWIMFIAPAKGMPDAEINDKVVHAGIFFVLMLTADITHSQVSLMRLSLVLAGYGMFTEISQGLLPYRDFSTLDWAADLGGLICGMVVIFLLRRRFPETAAIPARQK